MCECRKSTGKINNVLYINSHNSPHCLWNACHTSSRDQNGDLPYNYKSHNAPLSVSCIYGQLTSGVFKFSAINLLAALLVILRYIWCAGTMDEPISWCRRKAPDDQTTPLDPKPDFDPIRSCRWTHRERAVLAVGSSLFLPQSEIIPARGQRTRSLSLCSYRLFPFLDASRVLMRCASSFWCIFDLGLAVISSGLKRARLVWFGGWSGLLKVYNDDRVRQQAPVWLN